MLMDYEQELTTAGGQAVTANGYGTKNYDQKGAADAAVGEKLNAFYKVAVADFNNLTSMDIAIVGDDDGAGTNEVVIATKNVTLANLTKAKGVQRIATLPVGTRKRFYRMKFTVNGTAPAAGKIVGWLSSGDDDAPANNVFTL
jgi:hypothetical protein